MKHALMTAASKSRFRVATKIAESYQRNAKVRAVMVAGSVGRGSADRYSDLELDVYYDAPPTRSERIAAAERCGGVDIALAEDDIEWEEQFVVDGLHTSTSTFLKMTMERFLQITIDECRVDEDAQIRLSSLMLSKPLFGADIISRWSEIASQYPDRLVLSVLSNSLVFDAFGYAEDMYVARGDALILYRGFIRTAQQLMRGLMGLNRTYWPEPTGLKWLTDTIGTMELKPANLFERMQQTFCADLRRGVGSWMSLIDEVLSLVEEHVPRFDTEPVRARLLNRRHIWKDGR